MDEPPLDDGRIRFRYCFRRNLGSRNSTLSPCRAEAEAEAGGGLKQEDPPKATKSSSKTAHDGFVEAPIKPRSLDSVYHNSANQEFPRPQVVAATVDQPCTPVPASEASRGQMPWRYPSHVRVSAVLNCPSECGSNGTSSSGKDSPKANISSLIESAGAEKVLVEPMESQDRVSTRKRKGEEGAHDEKDKDSPMHNSAVKGSNSMEEIAAARWKVREALSLFETIYKRLVQVDSTKSKQPRPVLIPDMLAFKLFNEQNKELSKELSGRRHVGTVPGVEVGDEFHLRVELCIVGLHRQHRLVVDSTNQGQKNIAVSLVYSRQYTNDVGCSDVFDYSSSGDLKLNVNLALKNSMDNQIPIRVIHGFKGYQSSSTRETKTKKNVVTYIYDGLFLVEKYWRKKGSDGLYVCLFRFRRMPGQPELVMKRVKASKIIKDSSRGKVEAHNPVVNHIVDDKHLIMEDISQRKEKVPIPVVNTIDDEHPMPFKYITKLIYPQKHSPSPPRGCDCINGCSDSESCACAVKNGGEIPFNEIGAIVEAKPLVYECGTSCKCPPTCHGRVSQHGIKFQLEIFKTELRGWGVRSRDPIPSGSFICEYTGVLLDDQEADKQTNDEYLFDIGNNYYDEALWEGLKTSIPDLQKGDSFKEDEVGFAVDASEYGNVGRFVNHSCTPNLFAQNLLYDHDNKSMPHVVLFAAEDIPSMQELTYDYNYAIDQVRDSDGNIKKKNCYCGSIECTGWLY